MDPAMDSEIYISTHRPETISSISNDSVDKVDLLYSLKRIQKDSRYGYLSPSFTQIKDRSPEIQSQETNISSIFTRENSTCSTVASINPGENGFKPFDQDEILIDPWPKSINTKVQPLTSPTPVFSTKLPFSLHDIGVELQSVFGFQSDNVRNIIELVASQLDSRASRMQDDYKKALISLHSDYIGGENSNYRQWILSQKIDFDVKEISPSVPDTKYSCKTAEEFYKVDYSTCIPENHNTVEGKKNMYLLRMQHMSLKERARQLLHWNLIWGEAANIRFLPEAICFIFKLADDYFTMQSSSERQIEGAFLHNVITPLYKFLRDQGYVYDGKRLVRKEKDHANVIGYDDMNELFWTKEGIEKIQLKETKDRLMQLNICDRYDKFNEVNWKKAFEKTFKEKRTPLHLLVNFGYMAWVAGPIYAPELLLTEDGAVEFLTDPTTGEAMELDAQDLALKGATNVRWIVTGWGGALMCLFTIYLNFVEVSFLPNHKKIWKKVFYKLSILMLLLILNLLPTPYLLLFSKTDIVASILAVVQIIISILTMLALILIPQKIFGAPHDLTGNEVFTANFGSLKKNEKLLSVGFWCGVIFCKLLESLFFLMLPVGKPLRILIGIVGEECGSLQLVCSVSAKFAAAVLTLLVMVLFFLDTYLWWTLWSTAVGVARAFFLGLSILAPWRAIYQRLPERMHTKLFASHDMKKSQHKKILNAQLWNSICVSLFADHHLSLPTLEKLLYKKIIYEGRDTIEKPKFFVNHEDTSTKFEYFPPDSEAQRRLSFFAQSLSMVFPSPMSVDKMPAFSVLTPHYGEKILLGISEIIREQESSITLLEYLKSLHSDEWENFVNDTRTLYNKRLESYEETALNAFGFKEHSTDGILRTRIWASLRCQTLFRTVSGFMNYPKALSHLYHIETPDSDNSVNRNIVERKFTYVVAMQRFSVFSAEENENLELLFRLFPEIRIAFVEEVVEETDSLWFSSLVDKNCLRMDNGKWIPKYRIQLPGTPFLGDGKADNQNCALIYTRGEFVQLIDANQDNYFEEAIKIRNTLAEFENATAKDAASPPVAIIGGREFIFSEKIGVLGDVAAGKEYTFGTISQRTMTKIGARLHYGHPDFLNTIFMATRGGVSKAQKGLHLNEDIYAGMQAMQRGGRIKHTEYIQCGKGRDLGFSSILKFVAKIGAGMGEQILSREHYRLGTQLPFDRLLTVFYAHTGFHINNIFVMFSMQIFLIFLLTVAGLFIKLPSCDPKTGLPVESKTESDNTETLTTTETCTDFDGIIEWTKKQVFVIVAVLFVSFLPLFVQLLTEHGILVSVKRLVKQVFSFSPFFDVFTTQIYNYTLLYNITFGRAGYVATGRGFATSRNSFSQLYEAFAEPSIYIGMALSSMNDSVN
ncbi:1,3-beta-D-glucan synthase [Nowakowskiella sp. JEL0407]|nr:1,3-beta-D-glucan synthase [Nowakowskiella sp. JEL0407]